MVIILRSLIYIIHTVSKPTRMCLSLMNVKREAEHCACTHFLCFFSSSWLRLCWFSRCSLVSWSSAINLWHFFFACCTERWISSWSACRSVNCSKREKRDTRRWKEAKKKINRPFVSYSILHLLLKGCVLVEEIKPAPFSWIRAPV